MTKKAKILDTYGYLIIILSTIYLLGSNVYAVETPSPSSENCQFYSALEQKMQCGSKHYLKKVGLPLCNYYLNQAGLMTQDIQDWFPKVRYCLQAELAKDKETLTCDNLDQRAEKSHLTCYVKTGYCDLNFFDKMQLSAATAFQLPVSWWYKMLSVVNKACRNEP